jgi:hypothetical protein
MYVLWLKSILADRIFSKIHSWAGGIAQVTESLSSKGEALGSIPSTERKKKGKNI